jgi:ATP-binding cassette subfamily B protein
VLSRQGTTTMLAAGSALAALLAPGLVAVGGGISASELATCLVAAWALFQISAMGPEAFDIDYGRDAVRAFDRLSAQHHREPTGNAALPDVDGPPLVHFDGVGFSYLGTGRPVLDNVDLQLRPGEVLGVVGVNGAGKTTLMKLLAGLYRPSTGRITVHGTDLAAVDLQAWRRWLAVLFQDFVKYPLTVADNVALAAPEHRTDRAGILAALRAAGAQEMVDTLPDGLDTVLWRGGDGGADLSGGQWQRLAIARMLFAVGHGRRILVLDEPTAHLDVQAEADFYRAVVSAVSGVTVVLISHRLPTLRNADRIVVLDAGAIVECGSHDALLEQGGTYARLFRLQAARFTDRAFADRAFADRDGSA